LDGRGRARFAGHFDDRSGDWLRTALDRSLTYQRTFGLERHISDGDVALFAAIVARARRESAHLFPGSRFSVILWGYQDDPLFKRLSATLADRGLRVFPISAILPHYVDDPSRYQISPYDPHPNALAQGLIADYVVEHIVGPLAGSEP
jgi:hypothetical protein